MTHLRAILAVARKDAQDIFLDRAKIAGLLGPIALTLLWLLISRVIGTQTTTLLVYDPGQSRLEQVVSDAFSSSQITLANSPADVSAAFGANGSSNKKASYDVGLIIPAGFEQSLQAGNRPQVSLYVNEKNVSTQQDALLQAAITNYARTVAAPMPPLDLVAATINPEAKAVTAFSLRPKLYALVALALSFEVGLTLMPGLLIEEKEKKTLRMLMVSPASFGDVIMGKLLVVLVLQLALSLIMVALLGGFSGNVQLMLLYLLVGAAFALSVGLLIGSLLGTAAAAGGVEIIPIFAFIIPAVFIPLAPFLGANPIAQLIKILPSYYMSDGAFNALQKQGTFNGNVLDVGVTLGCAAITLLLTLWVLRRQSAVAATI
jgi:ABC-2 type transport system permease protein